MDPLTADPFALPDVAQMGRVGLRLLVALMVGGLLGFERETARKAAGLRTHMLVALGAALFGLVPAEAGMKEGDLGRVVQGIAAGVGFLGAGTILKRADEQAIQGLTTAASIWLTAALGLAVAVGQLWVGVFATLLAWIVLRGLGRLESRLGGRGV